MVMFDLAWMMSKDLNDMLWYVVYTHTHILVHSAASMLGVVPPANVSVT